jgi:hypothetical protein
MPEATGAQGAYKVHIADISSPEAITQSYNGAAAQGEIAASVWDGQHVNIITRGGGKGGGGSRNYRTIVAKSGTAQELEQSLTEATRDGGRIVSTVWDGKHVNVVIEG